MWSFLLHKGNSVLAILSEFGAAIHDRSFQDLCGDSAKGRVSCFHGKIEYFSSPAPLDTPLHPS